MYVGEVTGTHSIEQYPSDTTPSNDQNGTSAKRIENETHQRQPYVDMKASTEVTAPKGEEDETASAHGAEGVQVDEDVQRKGDMVFELETKRQGEACDTQPAALEGMPRQI